MVVASFTSFVGDHSVYAIFGLMLIAALLPAASELTMIYAGALAGGTFASQHVQLFGHRIDTPVWAFVTVAATGAIANTIGCAIGWAIGWYGEPLVLRHGKWLHITQARVDRAERWFDRFGTLAVPLGTAMPVIRSFVAIPAGFARMPLRRFLPLAFLGCAAFAFGLAAGGWALGSSYEHLHHDFTYVTIAVVVVAVAAIGYLVVRSRRTTLTRGADDSSR
jgi:membrane protein DedA with SNARE-associated domain